MNAAFDSNRHQFGKFTLVERLGRGGMAEVWKARISGPAGFSRTLVVKRILPHLVEDPQFVRMFVAEARLSARLNHANIVQVYELGDVDGEYYLAMEYVRGRDLVNLLRAQLVRGAPPPGLGAFVIREVCRALGHAHALVDEAGQPLRIIHRDVSPSNVMIGFDGAVKLLDFGIAKALAEAGENKTVTGTLKGKFGYMAPELVEGKEIDHRADLFAAGVVLHEALTGKRLFKGASDLQTIALVRDAKVEPPSLSNPAVPPELDAICRKALARDPAARFVDCDAMAAALDEVVHQLKWGPERLAASLRELFPDEPSHSQVMLPGIGETRPLENVHAGLPRRRPWPGLALGLAGLALVAGLGWLTMARRHPGPVPVALRPPPSSSPASPAPSRASPAAASPAPPAPPVASPPAPSSSPVTAPAPASAPPTQVKVQVVSSPPGAAVFLGAARAPAGRTPLELTLPRSTDPTRVTLRLRGYTSQTADLTPDSDSRLQMTLAPASPPRPPPRAHKHKRPPSSKPARPLPDLHRGDVVDPFAR